MTVPKGYVAVAGSERRPARGAKRFADADPAALCAHKDGIRTAIGWDRIAVSAKSSNQITPAITDAARRGRPAASCVDVLVAPARRTVRAGVFGSPRSPSWAGCQRDPPASSERSTRPPKEVSLINEIWLTIRLPRRTILADGNSPQPIFCSHLEGDRMPLIIPE
jgi:hypothetical protein